LTEQNRARPAPTNTLPQRAQVRVVLFLGSDPSSRAASELSSMADLPPEVYHTNIEIRMKFVPKTLDKLTNIVYSNGVRQKRQGAAKMAQEYPERIGWAAADALALAGRGQIGLAVQVGRRQTGLSEPAVWHLIRLAGRILAGAYADDLSDIRTGPDGVQDADGRWSAF
jgi:hypothetical protein